MVVAPAVMPKAKIGPHNDPFHTEPFYDFFDKPLWFHLHNLFGKRAFDQIIDAALIKKLLLFFLCRNDLLDVKHRIRRKLKCKYGSF